MQNHILDKIIAHKQKEVAWLKAHRPALKLEHSAFFERQTIALSRRLHQAESSGVIAEFKRKSPSKGIINDQVQVGDIAEGYEKAGAAGMSVLTDQDFFGGHPRDLMLARKHCDLPLLRKDFMIDEYQIIEAKALGADVILLIAAAISSQKTRELAQFANSFDMEVLLEVHNAEELESHFCEYVQLLGVNNRNLQTFEVSLEVSRQLAEQIPPDVVKVSESGIRSAEDIWQLRQYAYQGFLMGEHFMQTPQPAATLQNLVNQLQAKQV